MADNDRYSKMSDKDLCVYLVQVEEEYGVRVKVELSPLSRKSGRSTHAVIARAYDMRGKRIGDIDTAEVLFPGGTSKSFVGAAFYVATQLVQVIDTWSVRKQREEEQWQPGELTPLEEYIAGTIVS